MSVLIVVAGLGTMWAAQYHSATACKAQVLQQKLEIQRRLQEEAAQRRLERQQQSPEAGAPARSGAQPLGQGIYGDVFSPDSLRAPPAPSAPTTPPQGTWD
jgi:spermidine/putrescine transport system permease protein